MVRLKHSLALVFASINPYFNSTMVRLKQNTKVIKSNCRFIFQFHNGSIKTSIQQNYQNAPQKISIPQWFD